MCSKKLCSNEGTASLSIRPYAPDEEKMIREFLNEKGI